MSFNLNATNPGDYAVLESLENIVKMKLSRVNNQEEIVKAAYGLGRLGALKNREAFFSCFVSELERMEKASKSINEMKNYFSSNYLQYFNIKSV